MELPSYFTDFLQTIRPTPNQVDDYKCGHQSLRQRLREDEYTPALALEVFVPFLEKHYRGKYKKQGRSIGIELSYVDIDLVITAAPSESEVGILQAESVTTEDTPEDV